MEHNKSEVVLLEMTIEKVNELHMQALDELQLALVGGGGGDVVFA